MGREKNIKKNILYEGKTKLLTYLLIFIVRTVFVKYIAVEVLGINGIFTNLTLLFSIAESGLGAAFESLLYIPIRNKDEKNISFLIQRLKKEFLKICIIVAGISIAAYPILGWINSDIYVENFLIIYSMFALKSTLCYLFSTEETFLSALQKRYILSKNYQYGVIVRSIIQIFVLIISKSFVLYMAIQFFTDLLVHFKNAITCRQMNPCMFVHNKNEMPYDEKVIKERIQAGFLGHLSYVIMNGTDSIVITKVVGLYASGVYSNYLLIVQMLQGIENVIYSSITASIGDLIAENSIDNIRLVFDRVLFLGTLMSGFISICFYILANTFISFWIGEYYILSQEVVFLIAIVMFVGDFGYRKIIFIFKWTGGEFINDKWWTLLEGISNVFLSVVLGKRMGISGVLLATICTSIISTTSSIYVVSKNILNISAKKMICELMSYILRLITIMIALKILTMNFIINGWGSLAIIFLGVPFIATCSIHLLFFKNKNYDYYYTRIKQKVLSLVIFH